MGVILWYRVAFPTLGLTVSDDATSAGILSDAAITVDHALGRAGGFTVELATLPLAAHRALSGALDDRRGGAGGGVPVVITLGYLDAPGSRQAVLRGRVTGIGVSPRFPPLGVCLTGDEEAAHRLLTATGATDGDGLVHFHSVQTTPAAAAAAIVERSGGTLAAGASPAGEAQDFNLDGPNDFELLSDLARDCGAEFLVQDGTVQFGTAVAHPPQGPGPTVPADPSAALSALAGEDALIAPATGTVARLASFRPVRAATAGALRVAGDLPDDVSVAAFDFTVLGTPELRAGQLVAAGVAGFENPLRGYRIIELTHSSSREGYVCTGRAAAFTPAPGGLGLGGGGSDDANRRNTEAARRGSPAAVVEAISQRIRDARAVSPSVDVGEVSAAEPDRRVADLRYGQGAGPPAAAPSVDLAVIPGGPVLHGKPLAAPFAWYNTGLSVPVYPGMRALLHGVRGSRADTVVGGFLWSNEPTMARPAAKAGDWWLCLPTAISPGPNPRPIGKGANDLTAADGRRVIEAAGLKVVVGAAACSAVGDRPTEGAAEEFQLSHASGTALRIGPGGDVDLTAAAGAEVTVTAGGTSVTVSADQVRVAVGGSELNVTAEQASVSAGGVGLTLKQGKVAIG
ncbi:hypothetical protein ACFV4P_28115 [Kitasatospora sp. NPDC059795]|uniref:hypothetical protein n=1 Tax=Kitasatospora sp. NPDC059795 TaxID=3346949 RepID=UPI00365088FA